MQLNCSRAWLSACASLLANSVVGAQCVGRFVFDGRDAIPGVNGRVWVMTEWDPDGPGPSEPWLIAAGRFTAAGNVAAANIAGWDGEQWRALGDGLPSGAWDTITDLAVMDGQLYATGYPSSQPPFNLRVKRWVGGAWVDAGTMSPQPHMIVFNNELITGAQAFNGLNTRGLTGYSGTGVPMFAVVGSELFMVKGSALYRLGTPGWQLVWDAPGAGALYGMTAFESRLVMSGSVPTGPDSGTALISRWNGGGWTAMGPQNGLGIPTCFARHEGVLYCGSGVSGSTGPMMWTGSAWIRPFAADANGVRVLSSARGELIGATAASAYQATFDYGWPRAFDGTSWRSLGSGLVFDGANGLDADGGIAGGVWYGGALVVGGSFSVAGGRGVARRTDDGWSLVGGGVSGRLAKVRAVCNIEGGVVVAGNFDVAGDQAAVSVAQFTGGEWRALGDGLGSGSQSVECLREWNGRLYAGGSFTTSGGRSIRRLAVWDGVAWQQVGDGLAATVRSLEVHDGALYAGGEYQAADAAGNRSGVACWDGVSFRAVGGEEVARVKCLHAQGGELFAGLKFAPAGASPVLRLTVSGWEATPQLGVPTGQLHDASVFSFDGRLCVSGRIEGTTGWAAYARVLDGTWQSIGADPDGAMTGVVQHGGRSEVVGRFTRIAGVIANGYCRHSRAFAADIGGAGGVEGSDDELDNNDFIVFVTRFFAGDPRADVGNSATTTPDGQLDNSDFVWFVESFFAASCG